MAKNVTLADVAKRSNVSLSTVSLVLRDKPGIPSATRQRVINAAKTLGYRNKPRQASRTSSSHPNKLHNLGLILKAESGFVPQANPFYSQVLAGIEEACRRRRVNLLYATVAVDENNVPVETPYLLSENHVDGLLLVGAFMGETLSHILGDEPSPVVLVDAYASHDQYDAVVSDNLNGAYHAVNYLIEKGHRHIGVVGSHPNAYRSLGERRRGYLLALRDHGLTDTYYADSTWHDEDVAEATFNLLKRNPQITALFGCNDHAVIAALQALHTLGLQAPDQISLVGFDDIDLAQHVRPALTTMHVDKTGMGRMAVQMLANRVEFPHSEQVTSVLSPRLIERDSVRALS